MRNPRQFRTETGTKLILLVSRRELWLTCGSMNLTMRCHSSYRCHGCFKIVPLDTLGGVVPINGSDLMYFSILNIHSYTNPDDHDGMRYLWTTTTEWNHNLQPIRFYLKQLWHYSWVTHLDGDLERDHRIECCSQWKYYSLTIVLMFLGR